MSRLPGVVPPEPGYLLAAVSFACLYLSQQQVQLLTLIPLSSVKAQAINERLRQLGGTAKLVIDLLQYEPHMDRAFRYVCV